MFIAPSTQEGLNQAKGEDQDGRVPRVCPPAPPALGDLYLGPISLLATEDQGGHATAVAGRDIPQSFGTK